MITVFVALLLAMLTGHPAPAPAATVPAHVGARLAGPFDSAPLASRPQGRQRASGYRGSNPQAPTSPTTVPAPRTYFPQTWTVPTPTPVVSYPTTDLDTGPMCSDSIDCPTS